MRKSKGLRADPCGKPQVTSDYRNHEHLHTVSVKL